MRTTNYETGPERLPIEYPRIISAVPSPNIEAVYIDEQTGELWASPTILVVVELETTGLRGGRVLSTESRHLCLDRSCGSYDELNDHAPNLLGFKPASEPLSMDDWQDEIESMRRRLTRRQARSA